tara:strand:+ start:1296 stop:1880 length:585 start_codon:yes stop_codon:yes gene_type:complete
MNNFFNSKMDLKGKLLLGKKVTEVSSKCPLATVDVEDNIKNRDWTIKKFGYGPLNPDSPDPGFWEKKANLWSTNVETVKTARCGNCAAFDQSDVVIGCIKKGINETNAADPQDVLDLANLGYCQLFKFKCAATRTCDAWLHGGPIKDEQQKYMPETEVENELTNIVNQLYKASQTHRKQANRLEMLKNSMGVYG